jgi:hypothetical protein
MEDRVTLRPCDEFEHGFGWIAGEFLGRCSHALVADGRVWVIDPVDGPGVVERIRAAGEPAGVIQLLDRHNRDSRAVADALDVPLHVVPVEAIGAAPFEFRVVRKGWTWKEVALWWPAPRLLVVADALGTVGYFVAPGERLGVHPLLRLIPPRRRLAGLDPEVVLCGHGEGVMHGADKPFRDALRTSRRRLPAVLGSALRSRRKVSSGSQGKSP